jgi:ribosomal-protein-alanine N-acetyltransferase
MTIIRPSRSSDLDEIFSLESYWEYAPHWSKPQLEAELLRPDSIFLSAESPDSRLCGYFIGRVFGGDIQVLSVSVDPSYLRQSIAARLLDSAFSKARLSGCIRATLEVSEGNIPAFKLYQKLGFQIVGKRVKFYNDCSSALLMDKLL